MAGNGNTGLSENQQACKNNLLKKVVFVFRPNEIIFILNGKYAVLFLNPFQYQNDKL